MRRLPAPGILPGLGGSNASGRRRPHTPAPEGHEGHGVHEGEYVTEPAALIHHPMDGPIPNLLVSGDTRHGKKNGEDHA